MTLSPEKLAEWRAAEAAATPAPWVAEVDLFGDDEWEAAVSNVGTSILFTSGTGVPMYESDDRYPWSAEDSRLRDERCAQAKQSQAMRDATFMALAREAVPALLAENANLRDMLRVSDEQNAALGDANLAHIENTLLRHALRMACDEWLARLSPDVTPCMGSNFARDCIAEFRKLAGET